MGHALMENRSCLVVDACLTQADGHAERIAALHMIEPRADRPGRITLGADKGYDTEDFVNELRTLNVAPHVAAKAKGSAIDGRTTRHPGYKISQVIRKRIGGLRLDQVRRRPAQGPAPGAGARRLAVRPRHGRLQPDQAAEARRGRVIRPPGATPSSAPRGARNSRRKAARTRKPVRADPYFLSLLDSPSSRSERLHGAKFRAPWRRENRN